MNYEMPSMTIIYLETMVECTYGSLDGSDYGTVEDEGNTNIDDL